MTNFLPDNYELPTNETNFTKFEKDKTIKIRILESGMENQNCIIYYEYFQDQGDGKTKPVRSIKRFTETPGINAKSQVKEVWSFKVFNYETQSIQICSVSQKGIKEAVMGYIKDEEFGNPLGYDLKISRQGEGLETKYGVIATPPKPFDKNLIKEDKRIDWAGFLDSQKDIFLKD